MKLSFPGYLYQPSGEGPFPAMLLLHGSEGGNGDYWTEPGAESLPTGEAALVPMYARHFASSGFLAYAHRCFEGQKFEVGSPIPVEKIGARMLISFGTNDLVWGPEVQPLKLLERLRAANHPVEFVSFCNSQDVETTFRSIKEKTPGKSLVLRFEDEGHWLSTGSSSETLYKRVENLFLQD